MIGVFRGVLGATSGSHKLTGQLLVDGVAQTGNIILRGEAGAENAGAPVGQIWRYTAASANLVAKLQAKCQNNYNDVVKQDDSVLVAWQCSAP